MSIYIDYKRGGRNVTNLQNLVLNGKRGDLITLYPGYGYRGVVFNCVKMGSKTVNVYAFNRYWYSRDEHQTPVLKLTKDCITFLVAKYGYLTNTDVIGGWSFVSRGFMNLGIIPNVSLGYLRNGTLITDKNKIEVGSYFPMKMSWNGELLGRIPKEAKVFAERCHKNDREIRNRNARANYANTRVVRLMRESKEKDDWSKINTRDVFSLSNVTFRTELIEHFGIDIILKDMNAQTVDTDIIDGRKYELLRFIFPTPRKGQTIPATYLKMINPSTAETCVEGVPNNATNDWNTREITMNTVKQALAWRDGDPNQQYIVPVALT
jgi:hypothetical protein